MSLHIDQTYFLGDSLSDTENVFNFTGGASNPFAFPGPSAFPGSPFEEGRFSNGDIWVDYLSDEFELTIDPFIAGSNPSTGEIFLNLDDVNDGTNFAIGGANSRDGNLGIVPLGLEQQIDAFETLAENQNEEDFLDDLAFLWIGANNYLSFIGIGDDPETEIIESEFPRTRRKLKKTVSNTIDDITDAIQDIADVGIENVVVFNLPNLARLPLAQGLERRDQKKLMAMTRRHNNKLSKAIKRLEKCNSHINIVEIDAYDLFEEIFAHPHEFGFTNTTDNYSGVDLYTGVFPGFLPADDPNDYFFLDSVHPTTGVHSLIADLVIEELADEGLIL